MSLVLSNEFRVCGVAYSSHNAKKHCLAIIMTDSMKEDSEKMMKLIFEGTDSAKVKLVGLQSKFLSN